MNAKTRKARHHLRAQGEQISATDKSESSVSGGVRTAALLALGPKTGFPAFLCRFPFPPVLWGCSWSRAPISAPILMQNRKCCVTTLAPRDSKSRPRTATVGITSQKSHETTEFCVYPILNNRRCLEILASYFCFNKRRKKRSSDSLFQWILLYFFESEQPWGP